jgi:hypothetical protein
VKEYTKEEINEMRELLAESEFEGLRDKDLKQVLWDGCVGWVNIPDEDVISHYGEVVGFDVLED